MKRINPNSMRHLAARFIDVTCQSKENWSILHVVDPNFDYSSMFDQDAGGIHSDLVKRKICGVDVSSVKINYRDWWMLYAQYSHCLENDENRKELKRDLVHKNDCLLQVLALPNRLERNDHDSLSQKFSDQKACSFNDHSSLRGFLSTEPSRKLTFRRLQKSFFAVVRNCANSNLTRMNTPSMVRPAILSACNIPEINHPIVYEGGEPVFSLVGTSLASQISCLIQQKFSKNNNWPICLYSAGVCYSIMENRPAQEHKVCLLFLLDSKDEWLSLAHNTSVLIRALFESILNEKMSFKDVEPTNLHFYEQSATVLSIPNNNSDSVMRVSSIGTYISNRVNIEHELVADPSTKSLAYMGFIEIFVDRILLIFGGEKVL